MVGVTENVAQGEREVARLEGDIADVCGVINAAIGRLVDLIGRVLETGSWEGSGIRSAEQWVAWQCGVSPSRARTLVAMARRLGELPQTKRALEGGEISEDQAAVVCRHAPAHTDAQAADLARAATVVQLRRALGSYGFARPVEAPAQEAPEEPRRVSFGFGDDGSWRLSALLPADEGALWERALADARETLFRAAEHDPGPGATAAAVAWADALVAVADRSLSPGAAPRPHRDRHLVLLHVDTDASGHLHLGPGMVPGLRRYLSCDSRIRAVLEEGGRPVSVSRAFRTVPDRTRMVIEDRDRGCRVPGCERSRWLQVHHVTHWEDGGTTDTENLVALCSRHHRLHHLGRLGIAGNADEPEGLTFTDEGGRRLTGRGQPAPPNGNVVAAAQRLGIPSAHWSHPTGERLDGRWLHFHEPALLGGSTSRT